MTSNFIVVTADHHRRAYAAMRQWGDLDRDDDILEGACEARDLDASEIEVAAWWIAVTEYLRLNHPLVADFVPALLAESCAGAENLAMEHGVIIPASATARRNARRVAIRSLAKAS